MARKHRAVQQKGNLYTYYGFLSRFYSHISSCPRTGFPGHSDLMVTWSRLLIALAFQTRTGFPGHSDLEYAFIRLENDDLFQTRTGFPGHSDMPQSFMQPGGPSGFKPERASQAIPTMQLFNSIYRSFKFSSPNGLPRPFRLLVGQASPSTPPGFKPERASQAIPTLVPLGLGFGPPGFK